MERLEEYVRQVMRDWQVPGLGVGVISRGDVILCKGYGLCDVAAGRSVTSETLFGIGSVTKSFTSLALGILVDEGRLDWDKPVSDYMSDFRLHDRYAGQHATVRDLACHRTGVPRHNFALRDFALARSEIVRRLGHLVPSRELRAAWQYQNGMFAALGLLIERIAGCSWEQFVQARILEPLGMQGTRCTVTESRSSGQVALPYLRIKDAVLQVPFADIGPMRPAGAINSSVVDMLRWLGLHMGGAGEPGNRIISEARLAELHAPQMVIRDSETDHALIPISMCPEMGPACYGLGWLVQPYRGRTVVGHSGTIDGYRAMISFMPKEGLGVVVLSNLHASDVPVMVTYTAYDLLLGAEPFPWSAHFERASARDRELRVQTDGEITRARRPGTRPSHSLAEYAGVYSHPGYGTITVRTRGDGLGVDFAGMSFALEHYHYDTFAHSITVDELAVYHGFRMTLSFMTDARGRVGALESPLDPASQPIIFERV